MFYGVFAVFLVLTILFTIIAVAEYAGELSAGRRNGATLLVGTAVLLALSLWWQVDIIGHTPPNTGIQVLRALVFLLIAGPVLSPPVLATARGAIFGLGRLRRAFWRPASIVGLVMVVLWFLS